MIPPQRVVALAAALAMVTVTLPASTTAQEIPEAPDPPVGVSWCTDIEIQEDQPRLLEAGCPRDVIRPGAQPREGCTLNFILTDGERLYTSTAGHCGGEGKRWSLPGIGAFGTTVFRELQPAIGDYRDWALIEIDEEDEAHVDPTMARWGGPIVPADGLGTRAPVPGEPVLHYGHGAGLGREDATKGRAMEVLATLPGAIVLAGEAGVGDSGSPTRALTGQPVGITSAVAGIQTGDNRGVVEDGCSQIDTLLGDATYACLPWQTLCPELDGACGAPFRPGSMYGAVIAARFDAAVAAFEDHLGRDLTVVEGAPLGLGGLI